MKETAMKESAITPRFAPQPVRPGARRGASLLALALCLGACSSTPNWDARFGQSVRASLAAQVIDPGAARANRPVNGLDGKSAAAAHERYQHSAEAPAALGPMAVGGGSK